jgi:hypothetical protein
MQELEIMLESVAEKAARKVLDELPRAAPERAPLVDQAGVAKHLGVTVRTVYALRKKGGPCVLVGDAPRFDVDEVMAWLHTRKG